MMAAVRFLRLPQRFFSVCSKEPSLAFSHSPGRMFMTNVQDSAPSTGEKSEATGSDPQLNPFRFQLSQNPLLHSGASSMAVNKIRHLAAIIGEDPGQRGIQALFVEDDLLRSCLALSHASSVAITTGLPTHYMHEYAIAGQKPRGDLNPLRTRLSFSPPDETDGPPGAIAMATMLLSLGKRVTLVTDARALQMYSAIVEEAVRTGVLKSKIPLVVFQENVPNAALNFLCHNGDVTKPKYDHLMAIERSGRAQDGNYYNMRAVNIKHLLDPIDDLFIAAKDVPGISTTGIGDGGNELGMGKVKDKVKSLMPKGDLIACDVPADYAVTAGVSNWGGYAVACGLHLLRTCPVHQRYLNKGLGAKQASPEELQDWSANLPSVDKEESILATLVRFGIRSGKTAHLAMEVDGLTFHPTHSAIITRLLEVTKRDAFA